VAPGYDFQLFIVVEESVCAKDAPYKYALCWWLARKSIDPFSGLQASTVCL
jgi:hypothetical protein